MGVKIPQIYTEGYLERTLEMQMLLHVHTSVSISCLTCSSVNQHVRQNGGVVDGCLSIVLYLLFDFGMMTVSVTFHEQNDKDF